MKKKIRLKSPDEIKKIAESGKIIAEIFNFISAKSLDGLSTLEVDKLIEDMIFKAKARPAFQTVRNYSHATCICVNDEVVHGIPSKKKIIESGDIVKIDTGAVKNGFFSDACRTFPVGKISDSASKLIDVTREALNIGINCLYPGTRLGDMGAYIQDYVEKNGFSIVRDYTGHGVGFALHEPPVVLHYGTKGTGKMINEGMVLAIEPIVNAGRYTVRVLEDGWTAVTGDGSLSAQFEHTVAVTENGPVILTV